MTIPNEAISREILSRCFFCYRELIIPEDFDFFSAAPFSICGSCAFLDEWENDDEIEELE